MHWTDDEQIHLIKTITLYRKEIIHTKVKHARKVTQKLAEKIHRETPDVQRRTVNAINERLPYLENLLAGAFEKQDYAIKDRHLYSSLARETNGTKPNLRNVRHHYNGAMKKYLKNIKNINGEWAID